jgi:hypothetical protein
MATPELSEKNVVLEGNDTQKAPGKAQVESWSEAESKKRALKAWMICWGLALISIVFPIAHFFLVPGFFILGPVLFFYFKNVKSKVVEVKGPCPYCQSSFSLKNQPDQWPIAACCEACRKTFSIILN